MKKTELLLLSLTFFAVTANAAAKVHGSEADSSIRVRLQDYAEVDPKILDRALSTAAAVLDRAGIQATFLNCPLTMDELAVNKNCEMPTTRTDLYARILSPAMKPAVSNSTHTYGIALVSGSENPQFLSILYDNVERLAFERHQDSANGSAARAIPHQRYLGLLLGHVLAHEIGHLLLGNNRHTRDGLMRAHWSAADLRDALLGRLGFNRNQALKIRKEVARRSSADD